MSNSPALQRIEKPDVQVAVRAEAQLGEGTCWDAQRQVLYWVDILRHQLHIFDPAARQNRSFVMPEAPSAVVPTEHDTLLVAMKRRLVEVSTEGAIIRTVAEATAEPASNRFNDGKCDPQGRFWIGSMDEEAKPNMGALYCFCEGRLDKKLSPVGISNGLAWSLDAQELYYIDTLTKTVCAYPLDAGESLGSPRIVLTDPYPPAHLDGMTIDEEGHLWIAVCGAGRILRVHSQTGSILLEVILPVRLVTNCTFGGPAMDILYATTARVTLSEKELEQSPLSGSVFQITGLNVRGIPSRNAIMADHPAT